MGRNRSYATGSPTIGGFLSRSFVASPLCSKTRMETTLLEYLSLPNPILDCSKSSTGANTFNIRWDAVTGLEEWAEFNYETLMQSYGHILHTHAHYPSRPLVQAFKQCLSTQTPATLTTQIETESTDRFSSKVSRGTAQERNR